MWGVGKVGSTVALARGSAATTHGARAAWCYLVLLLGSIWVLGNWASLEGPCRSWGWPNLAGMVAEWGRGKVGWERGWGEEREKEKERKERGRKKGVSGLFGFENSILYPFSDFQNKVFVFTKIDSCFQYLVITTQSQTFDFKFEANEPEINKIDIKATWIPKFIN